MVVSNNLKSIDGVRIKEEYIKNFKIEIPAELTSSSYVNNFLFSHNPEYATELIVDNNKLILNNIPSDDIFKYLMVKLYSINEDESKW